jgi:2-oxoglutarate/2-oxoacid ferredoxin oxidoreductase subunit beta
MRVLSQAKAEQLFITGLIYIGEERPTLPDLLHVPETPLAFLEEKDLRPSQDALNKVMAGLGLE